MMGLEEYLKQCLAEGQQNEYMKSIGEYIEECKLYMEIGGHRKNFKVEKDVEEDLCDHFASQSCSEIVKNQVDCDCPKSKKQDNYTIDIVVKSSNGYLPIELKHSVSATRGEMEDDFEKLQFYVNHYKDMRKGLFIYYTDKEYDPLTCDLTCVPNIIDSERHFYYKIITREYDRYNSNKAISFDDRWEAKEMK